MHGDAARVWQKLLEFSLDVPEAQDPFSARLARENGWRITYARRVIHEYKRFVLLAVAAGHSVTPSDAVDQAWHLHLTYTRSYWDELCAGLLRRPLHHVPSDGTDNDRSKHRNDYANTLSSYERLFGERAPRDIWPPLSQRLVGNGAGLRVLRARHWVIAKPRAWRELAGTRGSFAANPWVLFVVLGGFAAVWFMSGPQYLWFHAVASAAGLATAALIQRRLQRGPRNPAEVEPLDAYQVAYLRGGAELAIESAVMSLVAQGVLEFHSDQTLLMRRGAAPAHPLELGVYEAVQSDGSPPVAVYHENMPRTQAIAERLQALGLLAPRSTLPILVVLAPVALGVLKVVVGMLRDKPVGILVLFCVVGALLALPFLPRAVRPTTAGKRVFSGLRARAGSAQALLGQAVPSMGVALAGAGAGMALALFGVRAFAGTELAALSSAWPRLRPSRAESGGAAGGTGDYDITFAGGSSCGGGGDGGGGGSGGGCGGCSGSGGD